MRCDAGDTGPLTEPLSPRLLPRDDGCFAVGGRGLLRWDGGCTPPEVVETSVTDRRLGTGSDCVATVVTFVPISGKSDVPKPQCTEIGRAYDSTR